MHPLSRVTSAPGIKVSGFGLHSGKPAEVRLFQGACGVRIFDAGRFLPIRQAEVVRTPRCTALTLPSGRRIDMVEHMLAALRICGAYDVDIVIEGEEVPVLDGSSRIWVDLIEDAGIATPVKAVRFADVTGLFEFSRGNSVFRAYPGPFSVSCQIHFDNPHIGKQSFHVDAADLDSVSAARTFALESEISALRAAGLAMGGSLENAVVIGDGGVLNSGGFLWPDECVRHKILDFIGDMMVIGYPMRGRFEISAPGHSVNNEFLEGMISAGKLRIP